MVIILKCDFTFSRFFLKLFWNITLFTIGRCSTHLQMSILTPNILVRLVDINKDSGRKLKSIKHTKVTTIIWHSYLAWLKPLYASHQWILLKCLILNAWLQFLFFIQIYEVRVSNMLQQEVQLIVSAGFDKMNNIFFIILRLSFYLN